MKTKSPPAARCPVPAKLPEPRLFKYSKVFNGYEWTAEIPLNTRPTKARLRAVQRLLTISPKEMIDLILEQSPYGTTYIQAELYLRALGLISKPGQHAAEKGTHA